MNGLHGKQAVKHSEHCGNFREGCSSRSDDVTFAYYGVTVHCMYMCDNTTMCNSNNPCAFDQMLCVAGRLLGVMRLQAA